MSEAKKFAVFDIDGTLIRWQLYHAVADALAKAGKVDPKDYQAVKDARMQWKKRSSSESFKSYERFLVDFYTKLLENLKVEDFNAAADSVFDEYKDQVYVYTRELIKKLKAQDYLLFALSGTQTELVDKVASYYGFDDFVGTTYEKSGKYFTGNLIAHLGKKHEVMAQLVKRHGATYKKSYGVGDSGGDISMLEAVENPIAFNPEDSLYKVARERDWKIVVERKNVIYELEAKDGASLLA